MDKPGLVFFGNECLSSACDYERAPILASLLGQNYNIEALIISRRKTSSRQIKEPASLALARKYGLKVVEITAPGELERAATGFQSEFAVLASFGFLISPAVLKHFRLGIVNVHPSLLPLYRGPTPIEAVLLNGETQTGVSLMRLEKHFDTGGIYAQQVLAIESGETKLNLTRRLAELASRMLVDTLLPIWQQKLLSKPQDHSLATYTEPIAASRPNDFKQHAAGYLERHIRAFAGCPNNKFLLNQRMVEILTARAEPDKTGRADVSYDKSSGCLRIRCLKDCLAVERLQPAGRRAMSASDFVNGFYRQLLSR